MSSILTIMGAIAASAGGGGAPVSPGDVETYTMPTGVPAPTVWYSPRDVTLVGSDITEFVNMGTGGVTYNATRATAPYCTVATDAGWNDKLVVTIPPVAAYTIGGGGIAPAFSAGGITTYKTGVETTFGSFDGYIGGPSTAEIIGSSGSNSFFSSLPTNCYIDGVETRVFLPATKRTVFGTVASTSSALTFLFRDDFSSSRDWYGITGDMMVWDEQLTLEQIGLVDTMLASYYTA